MKRLVAAAVFLLALSAAASALTQEALDCSSLVSTSEGMVKGHADKQYAACAFQGLPYAAPPKGELRLKAPVPPPARAGVFDADSVGFACPQKESITSGGEARGFDEDCLTLNIWRPRKSGSFPVMLWIHGGGFKQGSGTYEMYDGANLAADRDVVVVTINYRLGALGFMALPELAAEDENHSTGNYGLLDQVRALAWVRDNIQGFGGDPGNVTIFGQSAGGISVCSLLVSPPARGLFHRAINMSGPCDMLHTLEEGYGYGRALAQRLGCEGPAALECLRQKPASAFLDDGGNLMLQGGPAFTPHIDGQVIPDWPLDLIRMGKYHHVPVMAGTVRDELRLYTMMFPGLGLWPRSMASSITRLLAGPNADEMLALYSYSEFRRPADQVIAIMTDAVFSSRAFEMAEGLAPQSPVYFYRFDWDDTRMPHKMGAFHGLDIPLVFGALQIDSRMFKMLADKKAVASGEPLSEQMMSYYTNFARDGDPNGPGLPEWPAYNKDTRPRMYLDNPPHSAPLTADELKRYNYFAARGMAEIMAGVIKKK
ncbi:MAG TPA: carboxylesterase/lipase family protein [bacterium]|nr:carboxylesterase/lipase family protein [bacterium]